MRRLFSLCWVFFAIFAFSSTPVPYSGKISIGGLNFNGTAEFSFALTDANRTVHWRNGKDANESIRVSVINGRYSVLLGGQGMNPLPAELLLQHDELYLSVTFDAGDGQQYLGSNQRITASPYALVAEVAKKLPPGAITSTMLSPEVIAKLDANQSTTTVGTITRDMLSHEIQADLNRTTPAIGSITLSMLAPEVTTKLNSKVIESTSGSITRDMLPTDVLSDLNRTIVITRDMLPADVLSDLNRTIVITREMLPSDVLSDLNRTVSKSLLGNDVLTDLNATIGMNRLSAEVTARLDQNFTLLDGSVTENKIANKSIGKDQISDDILKYLRPEISKQPQAKAVYSDTDVSFSLSAEGKYLTYQWKKDGNNLVGETNATLTIVDANATHHNGNYSVVVSSDFGSVESGIVAVQVSDAMMNGLVAWWKFDETNGTVAYDSSGNGNDGNLTNGPTWITGKIGGGLSFDGVDDRVKIPYQIFNGKGNLTYTLWFAASSSSTSETRHAFLSAANSVDSGANGLLFWTRNYNLEIIDSGTTLSLSDSLTNEFWDDNWIYLTFVRNNSTFTTYSNSNELKSVSHQMDNLSVEQNGAWIGADQDSVNGGWQANQSLLGQIDEVRIYDRALSVAEIRALYNMGQ